MVSDFVQIMDIRIKNKYNKFTLYEYKAKFTYDKIILFNKYDDIYEDYPLLKDTEIYVEFNRIDIDHTVLTVMKYDFLTNFIQAKRVKVFYEKYNHSISRNKNEIISKSNKIDEVTIDDIDKMGGLEFEKFICVLFIKMGYKSNLTKASGDQGVDVIIENDLFKIGIQTKCYSDVVGNSAIQEATAGIKFYKCDKAMVITNNYFTKSAIELAKVNNVILWDRNILVRKINEYKIEK